ncbi:MAG: rhomboid family intramembrane serine protease [Pirellulales bacterium]|nr:rhomboid family intramembrane serine protease [Pirellulales bacterium]
MIPLRDNIPARTFPFMNYAMIGICSLVFVAQLSGVSEDETLVEQYGMIPVRVLHPNQTIVVAVERPVDTPRGVELVQEEHTVPLAAVPAWLTMMTCIFLHGGWMHFLGNMWFLHIFGDNVEDRLGHVGYLIFYVAAGVLASAAHLATDPTSAIPTIGASGAIAGVMGAYSCLYPHARVLAIVPIVIIVQMFVLPAWVFLAVWFVFQLYQGVFSIGAVEAAGVAWWAHIGGFVSGVIVAFVLNKIHYLRPEVDEIRPHTDHVGAYRVYPRRH